MSFLRRLAIVGLPALVGLTKATVGQVPDSARPRLGTLIGHVTDTVNTPLADAEVVFTWDRDSAAARSSMTNGQGDVVFKDLPAGESYTVLVRKIGYQAVRTSGIRVREGEIARVPIMLRPQVIVLPDIAADTKDRRFSLLPRFSFSPSRGFLGIRLFKCLVIGLADERAIGCTENADAHAARREARETAQEVDHVVRRVEKAAGAGRRPDPNDALLVLNTSRACGMGVPKRRPWPRPDPYVRCREILNRIPRETLARLETVLVAMEVTESFEAERQRLAEEGRRLQAEQRATKWATLIAQAEARYLAKQVEEAARRVDVAGKNGYPADSNDAFLLIDAAAACGTETPADEISCRAILDRTSRKKLGHLAQVLAAYDTPAQLDSVPNR